MLGRVLTVLATVSVTVLTVTMAPNAIPFGIALGSAVGEVALSQTGSVTSLAWIGIILSVFS